MSKQEYANSLVTELESAIAEYRARIARYSAEIQACEEAIAKYKAQSGLGV